jgi:hypothetical protein|tara:strand:- start:131 stop:253 length:123 start_codon:yes stop_codon:yes gene_type:complete
MIDYFQYQLGYSLPFIIVAGGFFLGVYGIYKFIKYLGRKK